MSGKNCERCKHGAYKCDQCVEALHQKLVCVFGLHFCDKLCAKEFFSEMIASGEATIKYGGA